MTNTSVTLPFEVALRVWTLAQEIDHYVDPEEKAAMKEFTARLGVKAKGLVRSVLWMQQPGQRKTHLDELERLVPLARMIPPELLPDRAEVQPKNDGRAA